MSHDSVSADARAERVVIIGSGPAAWTAAIYAARANLSPIVFEGEAIGAELPGGQLMLTTDIENFPGFTDAISGPDLMDRMRAQAVQHGARVVTERIVRADLAASPFTIVPSTSDPLRAHAVIVATGAAAMWLGLENELRLATSGGGVSACAICDGALPFYRNKVLAVVGGGDTAMEEAMYLTKFASEIVVIHRRDTFRASKVMANRVLTHPKIRVLWNTQVTDVLGDDVISGVTLTDTQTGVTSTLPVDGLFLAIGHKPNTAFLDGQLALTSQGYIQVTPGRTDTSVPGVFGAGDVIDDVYRQAITSAGTGCMAALEAERWLAHHGIGETPLPDPALRVLVLCTRNSARSQMAEALFKSIGGDRVIAASAGSDPGPGVHPLAVEALAELGIDWRGKPAQGIAALQDDPWDAVITVCDAARDACPYMPTAGLTAHWGLEDPAAAHGDHAAQLQAFRVARDILHEAITAFFATVDRARATPAGLDLREALSAGGAVIESSTVPSSATTSA